MTRIVRYALAGGLLALGAPVGLLLMRVRPRRLASEPFVDELRSDLPLYLYSGAATFTAFAIFGGVLGRQADKLAELATIDPLTGLANRRVFRARLQQDLARAERYQEPLSVLVVDVDGLKRVNDRSGHEAGDAALLTVAAAIRTELREADLGARVGGDEFAVLAPRTDQPAALVLAERLRQEIAHAAAAARRGRATVSIGVASMPAGAARGHDRLLDAADAAMYRAKRMGGDRVAAAQ